MNFEIKEDAIICENGHFVVLHISSQYETVELVCHECKEFMPVWNTVVDSDRI